MFKVKAMFISGVGLNSKKKQKPRRRMDLKMRSYSSEEENSKLMKEVKHESNYNILIEKVDVED